MTGEEGRGLEDLKGPEMEVEGGLTAGQVATTEAAGKPLALDAHHCVERSAAGGRERNVATSERVEGTAGARRGKKDGDEDPEDEDEEETPKLMIVEGRIRQPKTPAEWKAFVDSYVTDQLHLQPSLFHIDPNSPSQRNENTNPFSPFPPESCSNPYAGPSKPTKPQSTSQSQSTQPHRPDLEHAQEIAGRSSETVIPAAYVQGQDRNNSIGGGGVMAGLSEEQGEEEATPRPEQGENKRLEKGLRDLTIDPIPRPSYDRQISNGSSSRLSNDQQIPSSPIDRVPSGDSGSSLNTIPAHLQGNTNARTGSPSYQDPSIPNLEPGQMYNLRAGDLRPERSGNAKKRGEESLAKMLGQSGKRGEGRGSGIGAGAGVGAGVKVKGEGSAMTSATGEYVQAESQAGPSQSFARGGNVPDEVMKSAMEDAEGNIIPMEDAYGNKVQQESLTGLGEGGSSDPASPGVKVATRSTLRPGLNPLHPMVKTADRKNMKDEITPPEQGDSSNGLNSSEQTHTMRNKSGVTGESKFGSGSVNTDFYAANANEPERIRVWFETYGYMCAPRNNLDDLRTRLRTIRRLGIDMPGKATHKVRLDKFTRLAATVFQCAISSITIIGRDSQIFLSEIGLGANQMALEAGLCTHAALSVGQGMCIPDTANDWRFRNHPMVSCGAGPLRAYTGVPLVCGNGSDKVAIGTICIIDTKPRPDFDGRLTAVLHDLAACITAELERMAQEQAAVVNQRMHQVSVDFLRQSLQSGHPRNRMSKVAQRGSQLASQAGKVETTADFIAEDRTSMNVYAVACDLIRETLNAHACCVVDASNFHVFFPIKSANGFVGGSSSGTGTGTGTGSNDTASSRSFSSNSSMLASQAPYLNPADRHTARNLIKSTGRTMTPTVQYVPKRRRLNTQIGKGQDDANEELKVLGSACARKEHGFNFNTPEAKRIIAEFISINLRSRKVWFERDDSKAIANGLRTVLPRGTETSLAMPIFDYEGQCAFVFVACWTDDLHVYNTAALSFVETMCGTLMASAQRNKMAAIEQSQRLFASLANHEVRTPLHQLLSSNSLLKQLATSADDSGENGGEASISPALKQEIALLCDTLESSGRTLESLLNDVLDFLDVGGEHAEERDLARKGPQRDPIPMETVMFEVVQEAWEAEAKRRAVSGESMDGVEPIIELVPRETGKWQLDRDKMPLQRALSKLLDNAFRWTSTGSITILCEDISRQMHAPQGYRMSMPTSMVSIKVIDSGIGMSEAFIQENIFKPFAKADPYTSGAGLGVPLALRTIDLMGGTISFLSKSGKGTCATIEVPLSIDMAPTESDDSDPEADTQVFVCLVGFDNQDNPALKRIRSSLSRQLRRQRCQVVRKIEQADVVVIEEKFDPARIAGQLAAFTGDEESRIVLLGSPTNRNQQNSPKQLKVDGCTYPVTWLFRPLYPPLVDEIIKLGRRRQSDHRRTVMPSPTLSAHTGDDGYDFNKLDENETATTTATTSTEVELEAPPPLPTHDEADVSEGKIPVPRDPETSIRKVQRPKPDRLVSTPPPLTRQTTEDSVASPKATYKVLVVEDNIVNRRLLVGTLKKMGIHVAEAADGEEGIQEYTLFKPALVLMDINMPRKNGFEAAMAIREYEGTMNWPRCRIIAVTALQGEVLIRRGVVEAGIDEWVTKPVSIKQLRTDINALRAKRDEAATTDTDDDAVGSSNDFDTVNSST